MQLLFSSFNLNQLSKKIELKQGQMLATVLAKNKQWATA